MEGFSVHSKKNKLFVFMLIKTLHLIASLILFFVFFHSFALWIVSHICCLGCFDFLSASSAGKRDEHRSRDCAMSSIVHLSSGRACSSRVNGPCLVRVSSSTLAQEESSVATKRKKKMHDK